MFVLKFSSEFKLFGGGPPCPRTTSATLNESKLCSISKRFRFGFHQTLRDTEGKYVTSFESNWTIEIFRNNFLLKIDWIKVSTSYCCCFRESDEFFGDKPEQFQVGPRYQRMCIRDHKECGGWDKVSLRQFVSPPHFGQNQSAAAGGGPSVFNLIACHEDPRSALKST